MIVASTDFTEEHVRFTMAHELGHHLANDPRDPITENRDEMFSGDSIERRVNAFAAHLLMPVKGVEKVLAGSSVSGGELATGDARAQRVLGRLMQRFGVSLAALLVQLGEMGQLSDEDAKRLRQDLRVSREGRSTARRRLASGIPSLVLP